MEKNLYQKKLEEVMADYKTKKELVKIIYSDKLNQYSFEFKGKKITSEPLKPKFYRWMKQDVKLYCKIHRCMDSLEKIDPNIWFLIKKYEYTYGHDYSRDLKFEYLNSMSRISKYKDIPFRILYNMEEKKHNIFDRKRANVYKNIELQNEIQKKCDINIIEVEKNKNLENIKNNASQKSNNILRRLTAVAFAALAGIAIWGGESSNHSNEDKEKFSTMEEFDFDNETDSDEYIYSIGESYISDQTVIDESCDIVSTDIDELKENDSDNYSDYDDEKDNDFKEEYEEEYEENSIKVGDKIKIVSEDAKYYVDSYESGTAYSYDALEKNYQIEEVYAEYVTESGIVHGVGITKNNEEIHFGWLGKNVEIEKVADIDDYER